MPGNLRYAGENGVLVLLNQTSGELLLPAMSLENLMFSFPFILVKKDFIGNNGPSFREFSDGYELGFKVQPNDGNQVVDYVNALKAKAAGESADEFAAQVRLKSPDGPTLQITFRDLHWEGLPFNLGGRTEFLEMDHRTKGRDYKIQVI